MPRKANSQLLSRTRNFCKSILRFGTFTKKLLVTIIWQLFSSQFWHDNTQSTIKMEICLKNDVSGTNWTVCALFNNHENTIIKLVPSKNNWFWISMYLSDTMLQLKWIDYLSFIEECKYICIIPLNAWWKNPGIL